MEMRIAGIIVDGLLGALNLPYSAYRIEQIIYRDLSG